MVLIYAVGGIVVIWLAYRVLLPRIRTIYRRLRLFFGNAFGAAVAGAVLLFLLMAIGFYLLLPFFAIVIDNSLDSLQTEKSQEIAREDYFDIWCNLSHILTIAKVSSRQ